MRSGPFLLFWLICKAHIFFLIEFYYNIASIIQKTLNYKRHKIYFYCAPKYTWAPQVIHSLITAALNLPSFDKQRHKKAKYNILKEL